MKKLVLALPLLAVALTGCLEIRKGEKIGIVTKVVDESGLFCKTHEVELVRGGLNNGSGVLGQPFDATVEDDAVYAKLKHAMEQQKEVKVTYTNEAVTFCRSDSNNNFIKTVEVVESVKPQ